MSLNRKTTGMLCVAATAVAGGIVWWSLDGETDGGEQSAAAPQQSFLGENQPVVKTDGRQTVEFIEPLSENVFQLTRKKGVSVEERMKLARSLSRAMHDREQEALMAFISGSCPEGCPLAQWHGLVDVVMNTLRRQHKAPAGLTDTLVGIYQDSGDTVLQDYAIQHLRSWYVDRGHIDKHETRPEKQELILQTLLDAVGRKDKTFSGAALLALDDISSAPQLADDEVVQTQLASISGKLDQVVLDAALSEETDKHCRIDALQLCARRGLVESLPVARQLAADKNTDPSIRISAIALIGVLGNLEKDGPLLKSVKKQSRRYEWAAGPALEKLSNKL